MESTGIVQQIREHLASGETTAQVIALGFKPGTVYKVNRWLQHRAGGRSGASALVPLRGIGGARDTLLQGRVTVASDRDLGAVALYHFDRPVPCPGCGRPVVHWEMCSMCGALFPADCACPEDAPSRVHGYSLKQLRNSLAAG